MRRRVWRQVWALCAAAVLGVCPAAADDAPDGPVWRYGMLAAYPPFQIWPEHGWPGGADLDLLNAAAAAAGGRVVPLRYTDFDRLLADLRAGRIDVASAMAQTPARERDLVFGPAYAAIEQVMVVRERDADVPLTADLAGRRIAAVSAYASAEQVARLFPQAALVPVPEVESGLRALLEGRADVFIEAAPAVRETLDRLALGGLRIARRVVLGSGQLHLAAGRAAAPRLAPLADALQALGADARHAAIDRWSSAPRLSPAAERPPDAAEQAWLAALAPLRVAVVDGQAPFSMAGADGVPVGLSVDVVDAALRRLGLPPPHHELMAAEAALAALRNGDADLALGLPEAASRSSGVGFAGPFIEQPLVLVARREAGLWSLEQMGERRLALPTLQVPQTLLTARHPRVRPLACADIADCLRRVDRGEADAAAADVVSAAVALAGGRWPQLYIVGTAGDLRHERGVALSPAMRPLAAPLQRALNALVADEMPQIKKHWLERVPPRDAAGALLRRALPWAAAGLALIALAWWLHSRGLHAEVARTRAARQQAERALAAGQRFITFLAHEVRNSLHSVIAGTELLRGERGVPAAVVEPLGQSARSTLALLNALLDRERLAAGAFALDPGPARLHHLVHSGLHEMQPAARAAGTVLHGPAPCADDPLLNLDALRVQQVLRNLLSNAIKYASPGDVHVSVAAEPGPDGPWQVRLAVRDHGPGLGAAQRATLFQPFQAGHHGHPRTDSAGLGLALSRDLARRMGGELQVEDAPGGGLLATLSFPAERLPEPPEPAAPPGTRRVLVVEDAEVYAMLLRQALEHRGWQVELSGSVGEARQRLAAQHFDLLLTDLFLPDGSARDVLDGAQQVPARVVMSADVDAHARSVAGADAVLAKSADVAQFVGQLLGRVAARTAARPSVTP